MIVLAVTCSQVTASPRTSFGRIRSSPRPSLTAVTISSIARMPPSAPARSMPWIESDSA
jgi:hypothetical protein